MQNIASADVLDTILDHGGWLTVARISRETGREHQNIRKILDRLRLKGLVEQRWSKTKAGRLAIQVHATERARRWMWAHRQGLPPDKVGPLMDIITVLNGHDHPEHWSPDIDDHGNLDWGEPNGQGFFMAYPTRFLCVYLTQEESRCRHNLDQLKRRGYVVGKRPEAQSLWCPGNWHESNCLGWMITNAGEQLYVDWMLDILNTGDRATDALLRELVQPRRTA